MKASPRILSMITGTSSDRGPDLVRGPGPEAGPEIGTEEAADKESTRYHQGRQNHRVHLTHRHIQARAAIESMERRNTTTGARAEREIGSGTEITDGRNRAKRGTKVIVTAKRIRNGASMTKNVVGKSRPNEMMIRPHPMICRMCVVRQFRERKSRCTLTRTKMIWCEKRPEKSC